jgi:hypothetical protein
MIKLAALREVAKAAIPALAKDPSKLLVFADEGKTVAHGTGSLSFEYHYTGHLILTDMSDGADEVMAALLAWAQVNQPELLAVNDERHNITFEVDIVNHDAFDLSIKVPLTETVRVTTDAAGARHIHHVQEEAPEWMRQGLV